MNIKTVTGPVFPQEIKKIERRAQDSSADRDPNSQDESGQKPHHKMTEEELNHALDFLKALKGVRDNNLRVRVDQHDGVVVVYVEDLNGKVIRRIPETDLWLLTRDKESAKGHIFDKAG